MISDDLFNADFCQTALGRKNRKQYFVNNDTSFYDIMGNFYRIDIVDEYREQERATKQFKQEFTDIFGDNFFPQF